MPTPKITLLLSPLDLLALRCVAPDPSEAMARILADDLPGDVRRVLHMDPRTPLPADLPEPPAPAEEWAFCYQIDAPAPDGAPVEVRPPELLAWVAAAWGTTLEQAAYAIVRERLCWIASVDEALEPAEGWGGWDAEIVALAEFVREREEAA